LIFHNEQVQNMAADPARQRLVVGIVGRTNVGKSALFNRLTGGREALVGPQLGLTRDWKQGTCGLAEGLCCDLVDTAGLDGQDDPLDILGAANSRRIMQHIQLFMLVVDAKAGPVAGDLAIAQEVRQLGRPVVLVANKAEGRDELLVQANFAELGLGHALPVSALHGHGLRSLREALQGYCLSEHDDGQIEEGGERPRFAFVGRPNAGKSTLVNALLGEERLLTSDYPGTTRDRIMVPMTYRGRHLTLIDTAGMRRRSRVQDGAEGLSVGQAITSVDQADVVVVVVDASCGVTEQDTRLASLALRRGAGVVFALSKVDLLVDKTAQRRVTEELRFHAPTLAFCPVVPVAAQRGHGLVPLMQHVVQVADAVRADLSTTELTRIMSQAVTEHPPPLKLGGRRIKPRYAHQGGKRPLCVVIHGQGVEELDAAYQRYLTSRFRQSLGLPGAALQLALRSR
jgi:GTP-binding protein